MSSTKTFSIVVPVYQNELNLPSTIPALLGLQQQLPDYKLEIILVDDGSKDKSFQMLLHYREQYPHCLKVIKLSRNFGQISAIQAGLKNASGDCVGIISADLQDSPELFVTMIKKWEGGAKLIVSERSDREDKGIQTALAKLYWKVIKRFGMPDFPEGGFDHCLLDKAVVKELNKINEKNTNIFPLIFWLGFKCEKFPYVRKKREKGKSQWTFSRKTKLFVDTLIAFTYVPSRLITYLGLIVSLFAVSFSIYILISWFVLGTDTPEGTITIIMLLGIIGGAILFSLGIISEYLMRVLDEARKRPNYVIEEIFSRSEMQ